MFFLGIATEQSVLKGNTYPLYILCTTNSQYRSGYRVCKTNTNHHVKQKIALFTSMSGNEQMIQYLSNFRTRDYSDTIVDSRGIPYKYNVHGLLMYYECDRYGSMTGKCFYIKHVPDKNVKQNEKANRVRQKRAAMRKTWKDIFIEQPDMIEAPFTNVVVKLPQKRGRLSTKKYNPQYLHDKQDIFPTHVGKEDSGNPI